MASAAIAAERYAARFASRPQLVASAPGRVNLIGEHTDYNEGFALPMAIDRRVFVAIGLRSDARFVARSGDFDTELELARAGCDARPGSDWHDPVRGVLCELAPPLHGDDDGPGANLWIQSDLARGAGLASSAAVEMAVARAVCDLFRQPWDPLAIARLGQRVEWRYMDVRCGIMDQMIAAAATSGAAMLLDCRTLTSVPVALPLECAVVVMDTSVRRQLPATEYNERRDACQTALRAVLAAYPEVRALRDVTPDMLAAISMPEIPARRARHVVNENQRVQAFANALRKGDLAAAGEALNASHASLRDDYEVSSLHLDLVCELARSHPACLGARLTGAGFGGCALALVHAGSAQRFITEVQPKYEAATYEPANFFVARPDSGARVERFSE